MVAAATILSLAYGHSMEEIWRGFFDGGPMGLILWKIRVPRTILAFLVGGALAASGTTLQSILRNPLAEPYTLGLSGGAALGVSISVFAGFSTTLGMVSNPVMGFAGSMAASALVYWLARRRLFEPRSLVLFGIVAGLLFSSLVFFLIAVMDPDRMQTALMWLMGDLASLDVALVPYYVPLLAVPSLILFLFGRELDVISLGSEKARYLGVDPSRTYRTLFILTSVLTGLAVSAAGVIGFVGLVVPHLFRSLVGAGHTGLLLVSYLGGALFLMTADVIARYLLYPVELPVGVVTGLLGGFALLLMIVRRR